MADALSDTRLRGFRKVASVDEGDENRIVDMRVSTLQQFIARIDAAEALAAECAALRADNERLMETLALIDERMAAMLKWDPDSEKYPSAVRRAIKTTHVSHVRPALAPSPPGTRGGEDPQPAASPDTEGEGRGDPAGPREENPNP